MKNKEVTIQKIIKAVGVVLDSSGPSNLNVSRIANAAGVDRTLIYRYFKKNINNLIEAYIVQTDYWTKSMGKIKEEINLNKYEMPQDFLIDVLQNQWKDFSTNPEMQNLIAWELCSKSDLMRSIHNSRELLGETIFESVQDHFKDTTVNINAISALLVGGIYYANLHAKYNGAQICNIDISSIDGRQEILKSIRQVIELAYKQAESEKQQCA